MHPELEAILLAYRAAKEAKADEKERSRAIYESMLDAVIERQPGLSKDHLRSAVRRRYFHWQKAQQKPSSIPPKA